MGMGANPVNGADADGGEFNPLYQLATTAIGAGIGYLSAPKDKKLQSTLIGAGVGAGIGLLSNGTTSGLKGMWIGAGIGFAAPYVWQAVTGDYIKNKLLWGGIGALVGAGVGYGWAESVAPAGEKTAGYWGSDNFLANTGAFYKGLLGIHSLTGPADGGGYYAIPLKLWGDIKINLPKVSFTFKHISITNFIVKPHGYIPVVDFFQKPKRSEVSDVGLVWRWLIFGNPFYWPELILLDNIYIPIPHFRRR